MIKINDKVFEVKHFPDGTQLLNQICKIDTSIRFEWYYESDEELITLIFLAKHFSEKMPGIEKTLYIPYFPNARMDRTESDNEVFTLKYFADVINSLGFDSVKVLDPHSNVTPALIDRVIVRSPAEVIANAISMSNLGENGYIYFPDDGAYKRYKDFFPTMQNILVGHKVRDWETGKIQGLRVASPDGYEFEEGHFTGCNIMMIDDIISYGGTLAYSADELKRLGFEHIYAYATHTENSILDPEKGTLLKRLNDGIVDKIFTTDSIYRGQHEKIVVLFI